jgi:trk system potassium uptake protein TrkH
MIVGASPGQSRLSSERFRMSESLRKTVQKMPPAALVIFSYLAAALTGTILLTLPAASIGEPLSLIDGLFTATSGICVTGLIVVDTGTQFTVFGKTVLLVLIQMGGLGVMTFSVFLFIFLGRGMGLKGRWIISESFTATPIREIRSLLKAIILFTFVMEAVGTILLYLFWRHEMAAPSALFTSLFHSVSSFCNAGFSFFSTSFTAYRGSALLNGTVMTLIVVGGIGFPVMYELLQRVRHRERFRRRPLSLHMRMVLWTTLILIVSGAALVFALERGHALGELPWHEKMLTALFQSITARTAGFNTLDIPKLGGATLFILVMLMFIGASPGSTGGGIKTTSLAVMAAILGNKIRGKDSVSIFNRTVPEETVSRALSIFILAVVTITAGLIVLLITQMGATYSSKEFFLAYLFEAVSAFGTVGLSMGVTPTLTSAGKVVIIVLMLLGRVGLLTIAYVVTRRERVTLFRYAEEKVMIG